MSRGVGGPPRQQVSSAAPRRELLIFVEDLRTEETYLVDWHRRYRDQVQVTIDPYRAAPLQLVERAVEVKRAECLQNPGRFSLASRGERNDRGYEKLALVRDRSPMTPHFTTQQKALIFRLRSQGKSLRQIAKQLGCSHSGIDVVLKGQ